MDNNAIVVHQGRQPGLPWQQQRRFAADLDIETVENVETFSLLREEWDALVSLCPVTIYQTFDWQFLWWRHYGLDARRALNILLFREEGIIVGIIPLFLETTPCGIGSYKRLR